MTTKQKSELGLAEMMWIKGNFIAIAEQHKKTCEGEDCTINLTALAVSLRKMGIELSDEEYMSFA